MAPIISRCASSLARALLEMKKQKKPRRYKLFQGYLRGLFYVRFFNIPRAILFSSSFFCSIFCLSCKIESSWIITFVCPTVIDFRIIIHTSIEGMRKMSFFACPDLFYFDSFLLLYLKKTKGQHGKDMPSLLYIIIFCWKGFCSR